MILKALSVQLQLRPPKFSLYTFLFILFIIHGCAEGITSSSTKTRGVDLKQYKTYAWIKPGNSEDSAKLDDKYYAPHIVAFSNQELQKKGFVLDTEQPDALFLFDTQVEDRVSYSQTPQVSVGVGFGGPGYYGGVMAPVAGGEVIADTYQRAMLVIEMYDTKTNKLLWKGWAEEKVTMMNDIEADIRKATRDIFMRLPVKHKISKK